MSTAGQQDKPAAAPHDREIIVISHSGLFYWWPVWALGFVFALATWIDGHLLAIVPPGTKIHSSKEGAPPDTLTAPEGKSLVRFSRAEGNEAFEPRLRIADNKNYGVVFVIVLLLVIFITNVPLRGLWSVIVLIIIIMGTIILAALQVWEVILEQVGRMQVYINLGGYLTISLALFAMWAIVTFFFDRQLYIIFTPGGMRVREEIGGGDKTYDTMGMLVEKQRNDLFRHWILGLGSGDLVIRTSGTNAHTFHMPNVLFVGYKLRQIEDMVREKEVRTQN
jgi:hypothetical protein